MNKQVKSFKDSWIETSQGRLFARSWQPVGQGTEAGERPPIILFHDSLGCVEMWRTFPAVLAERTGRQVIAYDRLGFGQSDPRSERFTTEFMREEAQQFFSAVRTQLEFDRFIAFGHSVGGCMATHCAAMYPEDCEALVSESASVFVEDKTRAGILTAVEFFAQDEAFQRLQRYHGPKTQWIIDAWAAIWLSPEFSDWSLQDTLQQVTCPTLAIHGSEDEYGSNRHPEMIAGAVRGPARLEIMPGTRHVPHREEEERVARLVATFIE